MWAKPNLRGKNHRLVEGWIWNWNSTDWRGKDNGIRLFRGVPTAKTFRSPFWWAIPCSHALCPLKIKPTLIVSCWSQCLNMARARTICNSHYLCKDHSAIGPIDVLLCQWVSKRVWMKLWTQPVWKLAVIMWFPHKVKALIRNSTTTSIFWNHKFEKRKLRQALTGVWHEMINDHPTPSNHESGQFFPWKFHLSHELTHGLEGTWYTP